MGRTLKRCRIAIVFVLLLVVIVIVGVALLWNVQRISYFTLNEYDDVIANFPSDKLLGPVTSAKEAKEKAEAVWLEVYGDEVKKEKPYSVAYDENTGTWLVQGHLPWYMVGGVANILIQESDGSVLAVWHEK